MNRILPAFLLAAGVPLLLVGQGNVQGNSGAECPVLLDLAFEASGANDMVAAFPAQLQSQFEAQLQGNAGLDAAGRRRLVEVLKEAFPAAKIGRGMRQELLKSCDSEMLKAVVAGLRGPLGARMRGMEKSAGSPQFSREIEAYAKGLAQHPPARERLVLILRIDHSQGVSAFAVDSALATIRGVAAAFGSPPADGDIESMRKQMSGPLQKATLMNLLFTYRDAGDEELTKYAELYETLPFSRFNTGFKKAFLDSITQQSGEAGVELKKAIDSQRAGPGK